MMSEVKKVIVVTGAARGMGKCIGKRFLDKGFNVVLTDVLYDQLNEWAGNIPNALCIESDISNKQDVIELRDITIKRFGRVDGLANVAGIMYPGRKSLEDFDEHTWKKVFDVNVNGTFYMMQVFGKEMFRDGGSIVNIASLAGIYPVVGTGPYSPSKAAVISLTKLAAAEWGKYNIRVNAVCPGMVETDMNAERFSIPGVREARSKYCPIGRIGKVEDVANIVEFLMSDESNYISGETINLDGGQAVLTHQSIMEPIEVPPEKVRGKR